MSWRSRPIWSADDLERIVGGRAIAHVREAVPDEFDKTSPQPSRATATGSATEAPDPANPTMPPAGDSRTDKETVR